MAQPLYPSPEHMECLSSVTASNEDHTALMGWYFNMHRPPAWKFLMSDLVSATWPVHSRDD